MKKNVAKNRDVICKATPSRVNDEFELLILVEFEI